VGTGALVIASTTLSYPVRRRTLPTTVARAEALDQTLAWLALPFADAVEIDDPSTRGTRVSAGLDLESGRYWSGRPITAPRSGSGRASDPLTRVRSCTAVAAVVP
jgi:hypothetical protein